MTEGKYKLYCISLGLCILSNYYISIMVCIFLVLYFLVLVLTNCHTFRHMGKAVLRFALFSALAGGMAAILLIPEYSALHLTKFSDINFPSKLTFYFPPLICWRGIVWMWPWRRAGSLAQYLLWSRHFPSGSSDIFPTVRFPCGIRRCVSACWPSCW